MLLHPSFSESKLRTTLTFTLLLATCLSLLMSRSANAQTYTVLYSFKGPTSDGVTPFRLIVGPGGNLFGITCYGGLSYSGIAYELSSAGKETVLYNFNAGYGSCPGSIFSWNGEFYGSAGGGAYGFGTGVIFKLDQKGNEVVLYNFGRTATDGRDPALFFQSAEGALVGATLYGGIYGAGEIFKVDPSGKVKVLFSLPNSMSGWGISGLVPDGKGNLYGTTIGGGNSACSGGCGTVFKLDTAGNLTILHEFTGGADGGEIYGGVVRDADGNLYGNAAIGGSCSVQSGCGTVFKVDASGNETTLYSFKGGTDGLFPTGNLVRDAAGNLYGTTQEGGDLTCDNFINYGGCGTLFKVDPSGSETIVHTFTGAPGDGGSFGALLTMDSAGDIYGATYAGGELNCNWVSLESIGCGTIFKVIP